MRGAAAIAGHRFGCAQRVENRFLDRFGDGFEERIQMLIWQIMPVPPPTLPSATGPPVAESSAART